MKKLLLAGLIFTALLCAACGLPAEKEEQTTPPPPPSYTTVAPTPTPSPTPAPDFSQADFRGIWNVAGVIAPDGSHLSESEFARLDTDFYIEIIKDGVYFVYDGGGQVLGQGEYGVSMNILTLSAGGMQTVYIVVDENTLHCQSADDSVTVMTRNVDDDKGKDETSNDEDEERE